MPASYLSDADLWICVCYTRLAELAVQHRGNLQLDSAACDRLARNLHIAAVYQTMDPSLAAEAYVQALTTRVA